MLYTWCSYFFFPEPSFVKLRSPGKSGQLWIENARVVVQTHLNRLVKEIRLIFRPTHGPPLAGGDSLNAGRAAAKWCKKAAASHPPTHCTLLGCAFLTCKWPPVGFTHCASNLDTGTRPRILFSSTHLCIFVTYVSTQN